MPPPPTLMMQPAEAVKAVTDSVEAACRLIILDDPEPSLAQHEERRVRLDELGRQFAAGLAHLDAAGAAAEAAAGPKTETQVQEEMAALRRELAERDQLLLDTRHVVDKCVRELRAAVSISAQAPDVEDIKQDSVTAQADADMDDYSLLF